MVTAGTDTFCYDANGNMITRTVGSDNHELTYDEENRLADISGDVTASFTYDGDGARVKRSDANGTIVYVGNHYEKNTDTGVVTKYYYLGGKRIAMRVGNTLYYLFGDHLGSSSVSYRADGGDTRTQRYNPWGTIRSGPNNALPTDYTFTGQKLDESTGLMYYGARYYDPALGRFISADPIVPEPGNPQALNRYSYVLNNPLRFADPSGYQPMFDPGFGGGRRPIPPGRYIYTPDYGFFDTSHIGTGDPGFALEQAREAVRLGQTGLVRFHAPVFGGRGFFEGGYEIRGELVESAQVEGVVLAMYEDWSVRFEYWEGSFPIFGRGTSFAMEDLPSHHLGFYEATGTPREAIFESLGGVTQATDTGPSRAGEIENREFTPLVRVGPGQWRRKAWPAPLDAISPITDPALWHPVYFKARIVVGPAQVPWPLGRTTWQAK